MKARTFLIIALTLMVSSFAHAKGKYQKTQEVTFDGSEVDGVVRSPDGAYLVQKRGVKFVPLYEVKKQFDRGIKESVNYLQ